MKYSLATNELYLSGLPHNWKWFLGWGIALVILGILALTTAPFITLATVIFLGMLLLAGGLIVMIDSFQFWWKIWSGFIPHFLMGILYAGLGCLLIIGPVMGAISITLILSLFFIAIGLFKIFSSLFLRMAKWGWAFFNGLITLILGILIMAQWPVSGLFVIGLFIGIDLILIGWTYIMMALFSKSLIR